MKIEDYLKTERVFSNKIVNPFIESLSNEIKAQFNFNNIELLFINSLNKDIEIINWTNNFSYIIIDYGLLDDLYYLNKCYYYSDHPASVYRWMLEYYTENEYVLKGNRIPEQYIEMILNVTKDVSFNDTNSEILSIMILTQTIFLVFHEYYHFILASDPNKEETIRKVAEDYKDDIDHHITGPQNSRAVIDDYTQEITERYKHRKDKSKQHAIEEKERYSTEMDYFEEVHVDESATYLTLSKMLGIPYDYNFFNSAFSKSQNGMTKNLIIPIFIALHHLRIRSFIKIASNTDNIDFYVRGYNRSQTRISFFRNNIMEQYFVAENKDEAIEIQDVFRDFNVKYQKEIDDPILSYFGALEK